MSAALLHVMADGYRALALTLERWPTLVDSVIFAGMQSRPEGSRALLRPEIRVVRAPAAFEEMTSDEPRRCPWSPELLEVDLETGVILLWPGQPLDLGQVIAADANARRALGCALRQQGRAGDVDDSAIDWMADAHARLKPGPLADLVERAALEASRSGQLSPFTLRQISELLGVRQAA